jgi:AcrR family transcriptional regulator
MGAMPKLWSKTVEAHRVEVRDAILEATAALAAERGPLSVTMSEVAARAGIGRATLYKYFTDVESILMAWHERQVADHFRHLVQLRKAGGDASAKLEAVLDAYALILFDHHGTELAALLHRGEHVAHAQQQLSDLIRDLLAEAAEAGQVRTDTPPGELATYCLHAVAAASTLRSKPAVRRLVRVTLAGLRAPSERRRQR